MAAGMELFTITDDSCVLGDSDEEFNYVMDDPVLDDFTSSAFKKAVVTQ